MHCIKSIAKLKNLYFTLIFACVVTFIYFTLILAFFNNVFVNFAVFNDMDIHVLPFV